MLKVPLHALLPTGLIGRAEETYIHVYAYTRYESRDVIAKYVTVKVKVVGLRDDRANRSRTYH